MPRTTVTRPPAREPSRSPRPARTATWIVGAILLLVQVACGGDIESRMAEIRALQDVGQFSASIDELREVLTISPDLPEANYRLGLALVQTGEPSRAVWPLQKAAESSQYEISAGVLLASTHFQTRNYDEAIRAADHVLEVDPERQAAMRIRANANLAARRLEEALEDTSRLVELYPDDYGVRALHATVLGDLGRLEAAEKEHDLLKEMGEESDDPSFRNRACLAPAVFASEVLKDTEKARGLYDDCASRKPTDTVVVNHLVSFYDGQGETERGTKLWRDAVETAPENLGLRQGLAARLQAVGKGEEAEQVLRDAVDSFGSAAAWNLLANFHRARGEPEKALEAIEKVVELAGGGSEQVRFTLADVLIDLGEIERAREVTEGLSQATYAQLLRGRIHLVRGEPAEALAEFEKGIRAWPNNAAARFLAGIAARDLGDYDRAASEFREAVRADNSETDAALELARILYERGQYQQAVTFANMALRGRAGAEQPEPYAIAARSLAAVGQLDRARRTLDVLAAQGHEATAVRERVILERRISGVDAAVKVAEESGLDLADPENLEVLQQVVEAELAGERTASALARVEAALARSPEDPDLLELRGLVLTRAGRIAEARAAFEKVVESRPQSANAYAGLAALRAAEGDPKGAVGLFDRAAELSPHEGGYAYSAAQLVLAGGDEEAAIERLRRIVKHTPGVVGARNDLAWILAERGEELDLALSLAKEARRKEESPEVLDTLGWVHYQRGEFEEAVEVLQAAVDARPGSPSMRYRLGLALQKAGDQASAREMLESALASGSFPEAEEARRQLAQLAGS